MDDEKPEGYRGEGIFVNRTDVRVGNLGFSIDATTGEVGSVNTPTIEVRTDTFHHWLLVAKQGVEDAEAARAAAIDASKDDFVEAVEAEFRPSMQTITAAAFALDAFFASVIHQAPEARVNWRDGPARS